MATKQQVVQEKVDALKNQLVDNIEQLNRRGENIERLHDGAEALQMEADQFNKNAVAVRRASCWQLWRLRIIIIAVILVIILIVVGVVVSQNQGKK